MLNLQKKIYWKLTFARDKSYMRGPVLWFVDWVRYLTVFDKEKLL